MTDEDLDAMMADTNYWASKDLAVAIVALKTIASRTVADNVDAAYIARTALESIATIALKTMGK